MSYLVCAGDMPIKSWNSQPAPGSGSRRAAVGASAVLRTSSTTFERLLRGWGKKVFRVRISTSYSPIRQLWRFRGGWGEWLRWADDALARTETERDGRRADVLISAAGFANLLGDPTRAESYAVEGLAVSRHLGSSTHITGSLRLLAEVMIEVEEYAQAERLLEEATVHAKAAGDDSRVADASAVLGDLALRRGTETTIGRSL